MTPNFPTYGNVGNIFSWPDSQNAWRGEPEPANVFALCTPCQHPEASKGLSMREACRAET